MNDTNLRLLLEVFTLRMRFEYCDDVCKCFYDKVSNYLFESSDEFRPLKESLLHLIAFSNTSLERRLLKKFYKFVLLYF